MVSTNPHRPCAGLPRGRSRLLEPPAAFQRHMKHGPVRRRVRPRFPQSAPGFAAPPRASPWAASWRHASFVSPGRTNPAEAGLHVESSFTRIRGLYRWRGEPIHSTTCAPRLSSARRTPSHRTAARSRAFVRQTMSA